MNIESITKISRSAAIALTLGLVTAQASAEFVPNNGILNGTWDGWSLIAVDDGETEPGSGGQDFDAEYLFYRKNGNILDIGLQTGFNIDSNIVNYQGKDYWGGDLALSFDGDTDYEYGIDFGEDTKTYYNDPVNGGQDAAGLYSVSQWNEGVYNGHAASNPFAIEVGQLVDNALLSNVAGSGSVGGYVSFFRKVSIDLGTLNYSPTDDFSAALHWTMSCGNDVIEGMLSTPGDFNVPEPGNMAVVLMGLIGLGMASARGRRLRVKID